LIELLGIAGSIKMRSIDILHFSLKLSVAVAMHARAHPVRAWLLLNIDWILVCLLSLIPIGLIIENVADELMWASPGFVDATGNARQIQLQVDTFEGRRNCTDLNPLETHLRWHLQGLGPGCKTFLARPLHMAIFVIAPLFSNLRVPFTWLLGQQLVNSTLLVAITCAFGVQGGWMASVTLGVVLLVTFHLHKSARQSVEEHIAVAKTTLMLIGAVNELVLYTLIPQDVAPRVSLSANEGAPALKKKNLVAAPIAATSILFCFVVGGVRGSWPEHSFATLSCLVGLFNDAVKESGFFKYQHTGTQYIVTCLRAAAPFSVAAKTLEAYLPYQPQYLTSLVTLGQTLICITEDFFAEEFFTEKGGKTKPMSGERRNLFLKAGTVRPGRRCCGGRDTSFQLYLWRFHDHGGAHVYACHAWTHSHHGRFYALFIQCRSHAK